LFDGFAEHTVLYHELRHLSTGISASIMPPDPFQGMSAHHILFLKGGKAAEDGTCDELIEKNDLFADLVLRRMIAPQ
jgi:hypothetical protein